MRAVNVGGKVFYLEGEAPRIGSRVFLPFKLTPFKNSLGELRTNHLKEGLIIVSTLPNIEKEHCVQQIMELHDYGSKLLPPSTGILHFSSDTRETWYKAVGHLPIAVNGYSLAASDYDSNVHFKATFGVGVQGTNRIAHGLFALFHGKFLVVQIPDEQLGVPNIPRFIHDILDVKFS